MATAAAKKLIVDVKVLSSEERQQLREAMDALPAETPANILERKLRESGLVRHPPRRGPRRANMDPVPVKGKPLSEQFIEERR